MKSAVRYIFAAVAEAHAFELFAAEKSVHPGKTVGQVRPLYRAVAESQIAYAYQPFAEPHFFKRGAAVKGAVAYRTHAVGHGDFAYDGIVLERLVADGDDGQSGVDIRDIYALVDAAARTRHRVAAADGGVFQTLGAGDSAIAARALKVGMIARHTALQSHYVRRIVGAYIAIYISVKAVVGVLSILQLPFVPERGHGNFRRRARAILIGVIAAAARAVIVRGAAFFLTGGGDRVDKSQLMPERGNDDIAELILTKNVGIIAAAARAVVMPRYARPQTVGLDAADKYRVVTGRVDVWDFLQLLRTFSIGKQSAAFGALPIFIIAVLGTGGVFCPMKHHVVRTGACRHARGAYARRRGDKQQNGYLFHCIYPCDKFLTIKKLYFITHTVLIQ